MPRNKKADYIEELKEKLGINYHLELLDYARQKLLERMSREELTKERQSEYFWAVYRFKRVMDYLTDMPTCHFQSHYLLVSNPNSHGPESRRIISDQSYRDAKKNLDIRIKRGERKVEEIVVCNPKRIDKRANTSLEHRGIYSDCSFHCPFRGHIPYEDETRYYLICNRLKIVEKMREVGAKNLRQYREIIEFESIAITLAQKVCQRQSTFDIRREIAKKQLPKQTIDNIFKRTREIITEQTKLQ